MYVSNYTDEELITLVLTEGGTDREVELAARLAGALDTIEEMEDEDTIVGVPV